MTTIRLTFCCQHDHCDKASTDSTEFKTVHYEDGPLKFAYLLCNKHADALVQRHAEHMARTDHEVESE